MGKNHREEWENSLFVKDYNELNRAKTMIWSQNIVKFWLVEGYFLYLMKSLIVNFFLFFSLDCHLSFLSSTSSSVYIHWEFLLAVRAIQVSVTAWSTRCDSFIMTGILPLIAGAISTTFYNRLHRSRGIVYTVWNMEWYGDITNTINVRRYQWNWLWWSPYSGRKNWSWAVMFLKGRASLG